MKRLLVGLIVVIVAVGMAVVAWPEAIEAPGPAPAPSSPVGAAEPTAAFTSGPDSGPVPEARVIPVSIVTVQGEPAGSERLVLLQEDGGNRFLPIWVGRFEGDSIALSLEKVRMPRPLTHDLLKSVISALDAELDRVVITDLAEGVFYARLELVAGDRRIEVDSRPSDAMALAVRTGAQIYATEAVLELAGMTAEDPWEEPRFEPDPRRPLPSL